VAFRGLWVHLKASRLLVSRNLPEGMVVSRQGEYEWSPSEVAAPVASLYGNPGARVTRVVTDAGCEANDPSCYPSYDITLLAQPWKQRSLDIAFRSSDKNGRGHKEEYICAPGQFCERDSRVGHCKSCEASMWRRSARYSKNRERTTRALA